MSEPKLFAVAGNPVLHSRSPQIFNRLFNLFGMNAFYMRLAAESAEEAIQSAKAMKLEGLNVTSPFKEDIMRFLVKIDSHASVIGAVNCVINGSKGYVGHNTDFIGVCHSLRQSGFNPKNKKATVLGAGGAARAAVYSLIKARARKVVLLNRNEERARKLALHMGCDSSPLKDYKKVLAQSELLISCIPARSAILNQVCLRRGLVVMDANYRGSLFEDGSVRNSCQVISGLEWLFYQAIPSFHVFTRKKVPEDTREEIKKDLLNAKDSKKANIALIGFMGSGKTVIGKILARMMDWELLDSDSLIEKRTGQTIPEIFRQKGEEVFRDIERALLKEEIPFSKNKIISVGGGAVLHEETRKILTQCCHLVWLWCSARTGVQRINIQSRPLLDGSYPEKKAGQILERRIPLYATVCDLVINTETASAQNAARRIKDEMDKAFRG